MGPSSPPLTTILKEKSDDDDTDDSQFNTLIRNDISEVQSTTKGRRLKKKKGKEEDSPLEEVSDKSVLDSQLRVRGVKNLRVAGNEFFLLDLIYLRCFRNSSNSKWECSFDCCDGGLENC